MIPKMGVMSFRLAALMMVVLSVLVLSGCGPLNITSNPHTFQPSYEALPVFDGVRLVGLSNAYSSKQVVDVTARGPNWVGDLQAYTHSAITLLREELEKSNISVSEHSDKEMTLRVYDVNMIMGAWVIRCILKLDIQLPDGRILTYEGNNTSPTGFRALDGAILRTVEAALEDSAFLDFLDIFDGDRPNRL